MGSNVWELVEKNAGVPAPHFEGSDSVGLRYARESEVLTSFYAAISSAGSGLAFEIYLVDILLFYVI